MRKGSIPSLIGGAHGKPKLVETGRASSCVRCNSIIVGHAKCAEVPNLRRSFRTPQRYCLDCLRQIIAKSRQDLESIEQELSSTEGHE